MSALALYSVKVFHYDMADKCNVVAFQVYRNMGCIFSSDATDDGGILELPLLSGEVYVFVPGFREPTQNDLTELLKGSVSAALATKLQSLRSQVIAASSGTTVPGMKIRQSKLSLDGKARTSESLFICENIILFWLCFQTDSVFDVRCTLRRVSLYVYPL